MTRAKDISKIVTDANLSGTLDVTGDLTVDTSTLKVDSTNNRVGIGTSSPSAKTTIKTASNEEDAILIEQSDGTDVGSLRINNGRFVLSGKSTSQPVQIQTHDGNEDIEVDPNGFIKMETAGSERMRIDSSGNVGIATSTPQKTLDVRGTFAISNSNTSYWNFDRDDSDGALTIDDTNTERMRIDSSGNVGIGTNNPLNLLQIAGAIGLDNAVMASGTTSGDFDINISNQYTLNGSIWRQSGLLLFYNGVDTGLGNSTVLFTSIRLQGLSTWSSAVQSNIIGTASISDSNASSTGLTITVNVPNNNNGIVFVLALGGNKPTVTIAG